MHSDISPQGYFKKKKKKAFFFFSQLILSFFYRCVPNKLGLSLQNSPIKSSPTSPLGDAETQTREGGGGGGNWLDTCPQWKKEHTWRAAEIKGAKGGGNSNWRGDCLQSFADL